MIRLTALLLATAAISTPVVAADFFQTMPTDAEVRAVSSWTGFYIGGSVGGAFNPATPGTIQIDQDLDGDFNEPLVAPIAVPFGSNFTGARNGGFTGGIEAGYDHQFDQFVIGGIVDIGYVDYEDTFSAFSNTPAFYTQTSRVGWMGTIRARGGYLVTEDVLAYVHGGLAIAETNFSFSSNSPAASASRNNRNTSIGFQIGTGFEAKITENWSLGAEYAYTNLGDNDFTTRFSGVPAFGVAGADFRGSDRTLDFHTVKATAKYRF